MIIFVYNADSGKLNAAFDIAHKLISPSTYNCQLCEMTYGVLNERDSWKTFRESVSDELVFLHRDEFEKQYDQKFDYPVVLRKEGEVLKVLLSNKAINEMGNTDRLIERLQDELK